MYFQQKRLIFRLNTRNFNYLSKKVYNIDYKERLKTNIPERKILSIAQTTRYFLQMCKRCLK